MRQQRPKKMKGNKEEDAQWRPRRPKKSLARSSAHRRNKRGGELHTGLFQNRFTARCYIDVLIEKGDDRLDSLHVL